MRSALDHIAYAIARRRGRPARELRKAYFTIRKSGKEFNQAVKEGKLDLIGADWVKFLRHEQPYNRRNGLWRLSMLDNVDKHRELLSLAPIATVAVQRRGEAWQQYIASFKKGVIASPVEPDSNFVSAPRVTLANTGRSHEKRKEAFWELLDYRATIHGIVVDANKNFF